MNVPDLFRNILKHQHLRICVFKLFFRAHVLEEPSERNRKTTTKDDFAKSGKKRRDRAPRFRIVPHSAEHPFSAVQSRRANQREMQLHTKLVLRCPQAPCAKFELRTKIENVALVIRTTIAIHCENENL